MNSVKWTALSSIFQNFLGFAKNLILVRLLPVESFGVYAGAASFVIIAYTVATFGMNRAFIHRCEETDDIEQTSAVHFTLQLIMNIMWTIIMITGGLLFINRSEPGLLTSFLVLVISYTFVNLALTPDLYLQRQVQLKRVAILGIVNVIISFVLSVVLAKLNQPVWALLSTNIVTALMHITIFYIWKPVWKPRLVWSIPGFKYFLRFGSKEVTASLLLNSLDHIDDIWAKIFLGSKPLGYYSRAYSFAQFPSNFLANPILQVAVNSYAELKGNRKGLSEAFFETNSILIRTGFYAVGALTLIAPEFIRIVMGEKWIPMLLTFRLLLPFTMFDPLKKIMGSLFSVVGKPGVMVKIRAIQLAILIVLLFGLGKPFGIEGIALAVDIMMITGIVMILICIRSFVDFSIKQLFLNPFIGLILGVVTGFVMDPVFGILGNVWVTGISKLFLYTLIYGLILWILEKEQVIHFIRIGLKYLRR